MKYEEYINKYGDRYIKGMTYRFYNSILVKYHDRVEFEDVLQICETKVAFAINEYDKDIAGLNTFIAKVIKNGVYDVLKIERREKRKVYDNMVFLDQEIKGYKNESEMSLYNALQSTDEYDDINETIDKVCAFIKNERHKEYFRMYCQGYSIEEISKKYNTKYNGTKTILSRIRKRLREHEKEIREML
jgi:RNA polymerase sigma factor (sigma-70 family)